MIWQLSAVVTLIALVLSTAVGTVYCKHTSRKLFVELQRLELLRDDLESEWGRLQLEQSTWATHGRIERLARERLQMHLPSSTSTIVVSP